MSDAKPYIEGTPEKPSRPRYHWETERAAPLQAVIVDENNDEHELLLLVQRASGSFEERDDLEDYQTVYVPRPANWPPVQKITIKYLDNSGSLRDGIRKDDQRR
jgi:hypothetical protein